MTYQVLARKWRPRRFSELVGQEHVVRALTNALASDRLHHAYLFTGTRGVGKTTVARIFAKCLNCESGITAEPCGQCSTCRELDEGRFVDLIEVDAASRARVEETRDLMDNVQFTPARGRFKVYLIDEVHMFSAHSFNALLKTLEEPPPHVKFLLATTDPQKLPITVLSRCLQFHMRQLPAAEIGDHLRRLSEAEALSATDGALAVIARAAAGSMRDALSLLDQAIAHGDGQVDEDDVRAMLGVLRDDAPYDLLDALAGGDAGRLLDGVEALAAEAPDFGHLLGELLAALQRVAVAQAVADRDVDDPLHARISALAQQLTPEDVQLYYQIGVMGRRDQMFAPDERSGLEMTLLRMLTFRPSAAPAPDGAPDGTGTQSGAGTSAPRPGPPGRGADAMNSLAPTPASAASAAPGGAPVPGGRGAPTRSAAAEPSRVRPDTANPASRDTAPERPATAGAPARPLDAGGESGSVERAAEARHLVPGEWAGVVGELGLTGLARALADNTELVGCDGGRIALRTAPQHTQLCTGRTQDALRDALTAYLGQPVQLNVAIAELAAESPALAREREAQRQQAHATAAIREDPNVKAICDMFGATVDPDAVRPRES